MTNLDDQFDFEDLDDPKKNNKQSNKQKGKKNVNNDDDFFDIDDQTKPKKKQSMSLLPTINSKNSAKINKQREDSASNKMNPYANKNFGGKSTQNDYDNDYQQQIYDEEVGENKSKSINKIISNNNLNKKTNNISNNKSNISQEYGEQYLQEEQFQQPIFDSPKKPSNSNKVNASLKSIDNNVKKNQPTSSHTTKPLTLHNEKQKSKQIQKAKPVIKQKDKQPENQQYFEDDFQNQGYQNDQFENQDFESSKKKMDNSKKSITNNNAKNSNTVNPQKNNLTPANIPLPNQISKGSKGNSSNTANNNKLKQPENRSKSVVPPKIPLQQRSSTRNPIVLSNKNINKIESHSVNKKLPRSNSRASIRSNQDRSIKGSRITQKNQSEYFPNKHFDIVEKSFPQSQNKLNLLSQVQINKINEKMRAMIRKFNEQLNDLINKNMLLLKNKANQKQITLQDRIRQLQIQKKSGVTAIEVMQKDWDKLQGREGELKEQEYQLILEKQIEEKKLKLKQTLKEITNIKRQVDTKGKKLSIKQEDEKTAQNIHHIKSILIQTKKDEQKGDQKIQKLSNAQQELQTKMSDLDYRLDQLVSQAKEKGINIQNTTHLQKKYEEQKQRLQIVKNFNKKSQSLINTKAEILNHENQQVRLTIRNINSQINNLYGSIDYSLGESIKIIKSAKQKTKINPLFAQNLDKLLKQIEESKSSIDFAQMRAQIRSRRSQSQKNQSLKKSTDENLQKSIPLRVNHSQNQLVQENQQNDKIIKPKFIKKKNKEDIDLQIQNNNKNQRIWNQQQQNEKYKKSPQLQKDRNQKRISLEAQSKKKPVEQVISQIQAEQKKDKSKPFMLKKNKQQKKVNQQLQNTKVNQLQENLQYNNGFGNSNVNSKKIQGILALPEQAPKNQESSNIKLAPRMMKFGKKKNEQSQTNKNNESNSISEKIQSPVQKKLNLNSNSNNKTEETGLKIQLGNDKPSTQQAFDKPIFVPKRFNLKNKVQKKDDSYTPTVKNQNSLTKSPKQQDQKQPQASKQEYKPKFDFKNQEYKPKLPSQVNPVQVKKNTQNQNNPVIVGIQQPSQSSKPKFNLRLRDRVKKNNGDEEENSYNPSSKNIQPVLNKKQQNPINKIGGVNSNANSNSNNPYAPKQQENKQVSNVSNPYAPKVDQKPVTNLSNPYAPKLQQKPVQKQEIVNNPYNPYAPKINNQTNDQSYAPNQGPKRQRGGLLKKPKITSQNTQKQKINIYSQAQDLSQVKNIVGQNKNINSVNNSSSVNKTNPYAPSTNNQKKQQLNLNEMLGIKKDISKKNDFDDLLGDVGPIVGKNKKKGNDFFNDLEL